MNIKVEKLITDGDIAYKILSIAKCCDKIINSKSISINTEDDENNLDCDYENPEYSIKLNHEEQDGQFCISCYEKINFCPFCGKPININIVNERDVTEEYNRLCEESNGIRQLILKTDSISEKNALEEKLKDIQNQKRTLIINDDLRKEELS